MGILSDVKHQLGVAEGDDAFDEQLIVTINTVFYVLYDMGIGGASAFSIVDDNGTWDDFTTDISSHEAIKSYVALRTKMIFDPPNSSVVEKSYENMIEEIESRLYMNFNYIDEEV